MALTVEQYWRKFIEAFPKYKGVQFEAWSFGVDEDELANMKKILHEDSAKADDEDEDDEIAKMKALLEEYDD